MLDTLSSSLKNTLKKIANALFVNERLLDELLRDIQRALLQADVNVQLVFELTKKIKERALAEKTSGTITQREHLVTIVYEELVRFFGKEKKVIALPSKHKPFKIMMIGLFGSGKTTSAAKLAKYYTQRGFKVALVGLDVHRPAAPQQLQQLADQLHIPCYINLKEKNPLTIWKQHSKSFSQYDLLIIDTAGRDALNEDLIREIEAIHKIVQADENFLVLSADIGQAAQQQAKQFHQSCGVTGIIVTKLDGTAKGGGSLSACAATGAPLVFIGVGEKVDDLEEFNPTGFVGRLLGMGDLEALLEKAKSSLDETTAEDLSKRMLAGDFNFLDLYEQLQSMKKLGPLHKIMDLIPGMGGMQIPKEMLSVQEDKLETWKHIMNSCTKEELEQPELLTRTRIERIAQGAGVAVKDVRELLKQYQQSKKMFKMMKGKNPEKLMKQFGKMKTK